METLKARHVIEQVSILSDHLENLMTMRKLVQHFPRLREQTELSIESTERQIKNLEKALVTELENERQIA